MTNREEKLERFVAQNGWSEATRTLVAGDASNRRYERLTGAGGRTVILMDAPPEKGEDVRPFVDIAEYLTHHGLSAPQIYHQDAETGFLLIEDLGDDRFAEKMAAHPQRERSLYEASTDVLVALHKLPPLSLTEANADWLTDIASLVFDWYATSAAKQAKADFQELFHPMAAALDNQPKVVALRDYHAENLLWLPDRMGVARVGLLDFQDALLAHPAYDLVSVMQDARRDVSKEIEEQMITHYLSQTDHEPSAFRAAYALLGLQRNLRILSIFARLCLRDGKAHYVDKIPRVYDHVMHNLKNPTLAPLAEHLQGALPFPTPDLLKDLKARCATIHSP